MRLITGILIFGLAGCGSKFQAAKIEIASSNGSILRTCEPSIETIDCTDGNGNTGAQTCNSLGTAYGICGAPFSSCTAGYNLQVTMCVRNLCQPGSQTATCTDGSGNTGTQTCNSSGSGYGICGGPYSSCSAGYNLQGTTCVRNICTPNTQTSACTDGSGYIAVQTCNSVGSAYENCTRPATTTNANFTQGRGVNFFYLNGGAQDLPWVLDNIDDADVQAKIQGLVRDFVAANVNWVRLLIAASHFPSLEYTDPTSRSSRIDKVNQLLALIEASDTSGAMAVEVIFVSQTTSGLFTSIPGSGYTNDKAWLTAWLTGLKYANVGKILISGDLMPCDWSGSWVCQGELGATNLATNHGSWARDLWPWAKQNFPDIKLGIEIIASGLSHVADMNYASRVAAWQVANLTGLTEISTPIYASDPDGNFPPGASAALYREASAANLNVLSAVTHLPIWIDEYGMGISSRFSETDQKTAITGILAAASENVNVVGKIVWTTGNDYPYDSLQWFGLLSGFSGNSPIWRPAWDAISAAYRGSPLAIANDLPAISIVDAGAGCADFNCLWILLDNANPFVSVTVRDPSWNELMTYRPDEYIFVKGSPQTITLSLKSEAEKSYLHSSGLVVTVVSGDSRRWQSRAIPVH